MLNLKETVEYCSERTEYWLNKANEHERKAIAILEKYGYTDLNNVLGLEDIRKAVKDGKLSDSDMDELILQFALLKKSVGKVYAYNEVASEIED